MTIYLGADHGGFALKETIKPWLREWGYQFEDCGAVSFQPEDDYPDFAFMVAQKVAQTAKRDEAAMGVLLCRSGCGMAISANKVEGIRAAAVSSVQEAQHAREHNDANVISLAADWIDETVAKESLHAFLTTPASQEERHQRRIQKISAFERAQK